MRPPARVVPPGRDLVPESGRSDLAPFFGPEGLLARKLPAFEPRPGQQALAAAVAETLREGGVLAAEAETGIGKTLGYLIPAVRSGQKIVVSTGTLTLQDQILGKEIPFLLDHLDPQLTAVCVKGRQNYLCRHRWNQHLASRRLALLGSAGELEEIQSWLAETETGDRAELPFLPDYSPLWQEICSTPSRCLGSHCPEGGACFLNRLRKQAARSRLLIVNHHLFFSDLAIRRFGHGEVLPRYESVIFDEAHQLEGIATSYFGLSLSQHQLLELARDVEQAVAGSGSGRMGQPILQLARALAVQAERFAALFPPERGRFALDELMERQTAWPREADGLDQNLAALHRRLAELVGEGEVWAGFGRRAGELHQKFLEITTLASPGHIHWYERREKTVSLGASPLEIATELEKFLFQEVRSVVFASATLTTGGNFDYLREQLGLPPETETLVLASPFDYRSRTLLYVPEADFPPPGSPAHPDALQARLHELLMTSRGRALVLFTSIRAMQQAHHGLAGRLPYPVFMQGEAPKRVLLDRFQKQVDSVLLAVASFWEGVDVPGETLSCLIIDKLPFEMPGDPVLQARLDAIRQKGGNPFVEFQIPRAVLALRQGVGRLMRTAADRGLLAILDVRLFTKPYGRIFLNSLPPSPISRDLAEVARFFEAEQLK